MMPHGIGRVVVTRKAERQSRTRVKRSSTRAWTRTPRRVLNMLQPTMRSIAIIRVRLTRLNGRADSPNALRFSAAEGTRASNTRKDSEGPM